MSRLTSNLWIQGSALQIAADLSFAQGDPAEARRLAEQVLEMVNQESSLVSKATVYNTLNLFAECGLVKELSVDPTRRYYDSSTGPHHHFFNVDTGELTDIDPAEVDFSLLPDLPEGTVGESIEVFIKVRSSGD